MINTYTCWSDDPNETWEVESFDHDQAAEAYALHCYTKNGSDHEAVNSMDVYVRGESETRKFSIEVEFSPRFVADEDYDWQAEAEACKP